MGHPQLPRVTTALWLMYLVACTTHPPSEDTGDSDVEPPTAPMIGVHHIVNQWDDQALVEELDPGFLRINFQYERSTKALATGDWAAIDDVVWANADRRLLATVYPRDKAGHVNAADFLSLTDTLAERYGDAFAYWQLDNEPAFSPSRWPEGFDNYAKLLGDFAATVRAQDQDAELVLGGLAGFNATALSALEQELLRAVAAHPESATIDVLDLHHHQFWQQGSTTRQQLAATRAFIDDNAPALDHVRYLFTENSTYAGDPPGFPTQDAHQQAVFVFTSILAALSSGAEVCSFGVVMDRPRWAGEPTLHPFNLNGLYYNPRKNYGDAVELSGAKPAAQAHAILGLLTADLRPADLTWVEHPENTFAVKLGTHATVFWAEQATNHPLEQEGEVLTLDLLESIDVSDGERADLRGWGEYQSSIDLSANEPVIVLWAP